MTAHELATAIIEKVEADGNAMSNECYLNDAREEIISHIATALSAWKGGAGIGEALRPIDAHEFEKGLWKITPEKLDAQMGDVGFVFAREMNRSLFGQFDRQYVRGVEAVRLKGYYTHPGNINAIKSYGVSEDFAFQGQ